MKFKSKIFPILGLFILLAFLEISAAQERLYLNSSILSRYKTISAGEVILVNTEIILSREETETPVDIAIEYAIYDSKGSFLYKIKETKSLFLRMTTVKEVEIPLNAEKGSYSLVVKADYKDVTATSSDEFEIIEGPIYIPRFYTYIIIGIILLILLIFTFSLYYQYRKFKYMEKLVKKVSERDLIMRWKWF